MDLVKDDGRCIYRYSGTVATIDCIGRADISFASGDDESDDASLA